MTSEPSPYGAKAIGERVRVARKALGLTQEKLSEQAGSTSKRGIQDNEAGLSVPGGNMLAALSRAGANINWILTGEGPMLLPISTPPTSGHVLCSDVATYAITPAIHYEALATIIESALKVAPKAAPDVLAKHCASVYQQYVEAGLISVDMSRMDDEYR